VRFTVARPTAALSADELGLAVTTHKLDDGATRLLCSSRRLAYGVHVEVPGYKPSDNLFCIEPGHCRTVRLHAIGREPSPISGTLTAVNLSGHVAIETDPRADTA
jgi:hypothetical protein